jgi:hypothetical protein
MPGMFGRTVNAASGGLGRLASAIGGGGDGSYEKARRGEMEFQSNIAKAMAQMEASGASARLHNLQADGEQDQLARRKPEALLDSALTTHGIPTEERSAVDHFLKSGALGGKYRPGANDMGPVAPAPDWQDKLGAVARHLGNVNGALTLGGKNIEDVAKANAIGTLEERKGAVINGKLDPMRFSQAEFAARGSAPFSFHEFGTGNNLTGAVDDQNGPARRYGEYRTETTKSQKANQVQSYASAGASNASAENSRAHAAKAKQELEMGAKGSLQMTDQGLLLVDPRNATSRPVMGPNGSVAGKPKEAEKPLPAAAAKGYLDNIQNLERAQKALDLIEGKAVGDAKGDPNATGFKGLLPNQILNRVDPDGIDARAAISDLGSLVIHDRSGAAVTAAEYPRLAPFIPSAIDNPATVKKKLKLFAQNYRAIVDDAAEFYRASGYNVPTLNRSKPAASGAPKTSAAPAAPAGGGFTYLGKE